MGNFANHWRYKTKIRRLLLINGLQGISQHNLNQKTRTRIFNNIDMLEVLDDWYINQWVQRFQIKTPANRDTVIWRATKLLLTEWSSLAIDGELPITTVQTPIISPENLVG